MSHQHIHSQSQYLIRHVWEGYIVCSKKLRTTALEQGYGASVRLTLSPHTFAFKQPFNCRGVHSLVFFIITMECSLNSKCFLATYSMKYVHSVCGSHSLQRLGCLWHAAGTFCCALIAGNWFETLCCGNKTIKCNCETWVSGKKGHCTQAKGMCDSHY